MKKHQLLMSAAILILSACGQSIRSNEGATQADSVAVGQHGDERGLYASMRIKDIIKVGDPVELTFSVYNNADSTQQFCKWHTPFEPLLSKYLDIKDENGEEVAYKGPMAKRIMPPPADSYIKVPAKDSLTVNVDLLKGYAITKPAKYTVIYNARDMSGLTVKDSVTFNYQK